MRSGRAQVLGALSVAVVVAAGFVGCGDESAGGPTPAAQSSSSPLSSDAGGSDSGGGSDGGGEASGRTPNLPPENAALEAPDFKDYTGIKYETDQGAQETAKYFFDAMYYAYATGDTEALRESSNLETCGACNRLIDEIDKWRSRGTYLSPATIEHVDSWVSGKKDGISEVHYIFRVNDVKKFTKGEELEQFPSKEYASGFRMKFANGKWQIHGVAWKGSDEVE